MSPFQAILVPVDGSPSSLAALEHAVVLAEDANARVAVLHVAVGEKFAVGASSPMTTEARVETDDAMDAAIERARVRLDGRISRRIAAGEPLRTIIQTARDGQYDLIVIGTHGRIGRLHALLGSVAEEVVRNAPCPVMTIREPDGGYQSFAERRHGRPSVSEASSHHPR